MGFFWRIADCNPDVFDHRVKVEFCKVHVCQPRRTQPLHFPRLNRSTQGKRAQHAVASGGALVGEVQYQAVGQMQPGADQRVGCAVVQRMQLGQLGACLVEVALAGEQAGALGAQAGGVQRAASSGDTGVDRREQRRRHGRRMFRPLQPPPSGGSVRPVRRSNASRYVAAVCAATSAGSGGAGARLFHGMPSMRTPSSQSRTNCLS